MRRFLPLLLVSAACSPAGTHSASPSSEIAPSPATLFDMARHARIAYLSTDAIRTELQRLNLRDVTFVTDPASSLFSYLVKTPACSLIVVRGTKEVEDWILDFDFAQVDAKPALGVQGKVHSGFHAQARAALATLVRITPKDKPVCVTGHSLGGAVAALVGASLAVKSGHQVTSVVTFGAPKMGDFAFQTSYNTALGERTTNLVLERDLVPRVPPHNAVETEFVTHIPGFLLHEFRARGLGREEYGCFGRRYRLHRDTGAMKLLAGRTLIAGRPVDDWALGCRDDDLQFWKSMGFLEGEAFRRAAGAAEHHVIEAYLKGMCKWSPQAGDCPGS